MKITRSLRDRLVLSTAVAASLALLGGGCLAYRLLAEQLREAHDRSLLHKLAILAACVGQTDEDIVWLPSIRLDPASQSGEEQKKLVMERLIRSMAEPEELIFYQIRRDDGSAVYSSENLLGLDLPRVAAPGREPSLSDAVMADGTPVRIVCHWVTPMTTEVRPQPNAQGGLYQQGLIYLAQSQHGLRQTLFRVRLILAQAGLLTIAAVFLVARVLVRNALLPLHQLSREIQSIPLDGSQRFSRPTVASELEPIVDRLNGLMNRVDEALTREREFTSNAAHELRTPLAGLRAKLELALSRPRDAQAYREALAEGLVIERRLQSLVENLLLLARLRNHQLTFAPKPFSVSQLLARTWGEFFDEAEARQLAVAFHVPTDGPPLWSVEDLLSIPVRNVFDNAVSYTPVGGRIDISAQPVGDAWEVRVTNTNPGLRADQISEIFTPFWRASRQDGAADRHAGIGLALSARIMKELRGGITVQLTGEEEVRATLTVANFKPLLTP